MNEHIEDRTKNTLSEDRILSFLSETRLPVRTFRTIDSTNTHARRLLEEGLQPPFLLCADEQTAGRGRRGNTFFSPLSGLYYTLVIKPEKEEEAIAKMTLAAAVSALEAIRDTAGITCEIKWVNDLYLNRRKVAGILCEAPRNSSGELYGIIIGIGINICQKEFPEELRDKAGSLNCPHLDKNLLAAALTRRLLERAEFPDDEELIRTYRKHSFLIGKEVTFSLDGKTCSGVAEDIGSDGSLIVRGEKVWTLSSGEVSLSRWE